MSTAPVRKTYQQRRTAADLGPVLTHYRRPVFHHGDSWRLWLPATLAVMGPLAYGGWLAGVYYTQYGPVAAEVRSRPWYALASLALLVFLLIVILRVLRTRPRAAIHQNGVFIRPGFSKEYRLLWDDLAGIAATISQTHFLGWRFPQKMNIRIFPKSGPFISVNNDGGFLPGLTECIKGHLYPRLMPVYQAALYSGQWINFGKISIQREGFRIRPPRGKDAPTDAWENTERVWVENGFLMIDIKPSSQMGKSIRRVLPTAEIPNIELLMQLIQQGVNA